MDDNFEKAYKITSGHEGGYANNPADKGGETYCGISRRFHPYWEGWAIIDREKALHGGELPNNWKIADPELDKAIMQFYFEEYWLKCKCDQMPYEIGRDIFDIAVNSGHGKAGEILQRALNGSNRVGKLWGNLKVDGSIGNKTILAVKEAEINRRTWLVNTWINCLRGAFYIEIMERNEGQEEFAVSWASRIEIERV